MSRLEVSDRILGSHSVPAPRGPGLSGWPTWHWRRLLARRARRAFQFHLERPELGETFSGYLLPVFGWACSYRERVQAVLVEHESEIQRLAVRVVRPDVAAAHPQAVGTPRLGFFGHV